MPTNILSNLIATRVRTLIWIETKGGLNEAHKEAKERAVEDINYLTKNFMPSGSGFDNGTICKIASCTPSKLVFIAPFHHMNDVGMYDGWTDHDVTVRSEFDGVDIKVSGRNKRDIKDYIAETFQTALAQRIVSIWDSYNKEMDFRLER